MDDATQPPRPNEPSRNEEGDRRARERRDRLAKALRDNLVRRKAQQRARLRGDPPPAAETDPAGSSGG